MTSAIRRRAKDCNIQMTLLARAVPSVQEKIEMKTGKMIELEFPRHDTLINNFTSRLASGT